MTPGGPPLADAEYVLPLRWADDRDLPDLVAYLGALVGWLPVTVVDGSDAERFAAHARAFPAGVRHVRPDPHPGRNGKVAGVLTGLRLVTADRIVVADESVTLPRAAAGLEIRTDGLWASLLCETAFEHWSLGLEAFGLRLDAEAVGDDPPSWADLVGERLPVGFDLEWELRAPPEPLIDGLGYRQVGTLFGELLVVRDRIEIEAILKEFKLPVPAK